nr:MAG TPA: hypothetical protein [Caudoviricetes sp.]
MPSHLIATEVIGSLLMAQTVVGYRSTNCVQSK